MKTTINQIVMQEINKSALVKAIKRKLTAEQKPKRKPVRLCKSLSVCVFVATIVVVVVAIIIVVVVYVSFSCCCRCCIVCNFRCAQL